MKLETNQINQINLDINCIKSLYYEYLPQKVNLVSFQTEKFFKKQILKIHSKRNYKKVRAFQINQINHFTHILTNREDERVNLLVNLADLVNIGFKAYRERCIYG